MAAFKTRSQAVPKSDGQSRSASHFSSVFEGKSLTLQSVSHKVEMNEILLSVGA